MRAQGNCLSLVTSPDKGWAESCVFGNLHAEFGCRFEVSRFNRRLVSVSPCKGVEEVALDKQRSWTAMRLPQRRQPVPQWALSLRRPCGVVPNWAKGRSLRAPGLASHWVLTGPKKVVYPRVMRRLSLKQLSKSATNSSCSPGTWGPSFSRVGGAECPVIHGSLHESDPRGQRWGWEDWEGSDGEEEAASRSTSSHRAGRCSGHPGSCWEPPGELCRMHKSVHLRHGKWSTYALAPLPGGQWGCSRDVHSLTLVDLRLCWNSWADSCRTPT